MNLEILNVYSGGIVSYKVKCLNCGKDFQPDGGGQRYCSLCSPDIFKDKTKERNRLYYQNNKVNKI